MLILKLRKKGQDLYQVSTASDTVKKLILHIQMEFSVTSITNATVGMDISTVGVVWSLSKVIIINQTPLIFEYKQNVEKIGIKKIVFLHIP